MVKNKQCGIMESSSFEKLIEMSVLAPSGHNTQPWKFVRGVDCITIEPDLSRRLKVVDPHNRELFISVGCAVENMCQAATTMHLRTEVTVGERGDVTVSFTADDSVQPSALSKFITKRSTNRRNYDGRMIPPADVAALEACGAKLYARDSKTYSFLVNYVAQGNEEQMENAAFANELKSWMRYNESHAAEHGDGLCYDVFGAPNMPMCISRRVMSSMLTPKKQNRSDIKKLSSSSHLALFTAAHSTESWIATGRSLERFLLMATSLGVSYAFLNQPCEVRALASEMRKFFNLENSPQLLLRLGYASPLPHSRRRPLDTFLSTDSNAEEIEG